MLRKASLSVAEIVIDILAFATYIWRHFVSFVSGIAVLVYGVVELATWWAVDLLIYEPDSVAIFTTLGKVLWEMAQQIYLLATAGEWNTTLAVLAFGFLYALLKAQAGVRRIIRRQLNRRRAKNSAA